MRGEAKREAYVRIVEARFCLTDSWRALFHVSGQTLILIFCVCVSVGSERGARGAKRGCRRVVACRSILAKFVCNVAYIRVYIRGRPVCLQISNLRLANPLLAAHGKTHTLTPYVLSTG